MKLLGLIVASVSAFGGMVGGRGGMPPAYLFVEDYDKVHCHDFFPINKFKDKSKKLFEIIS